MHIGELTKLEETARAIKITAQGDKLDGRNDRPIYLPKTQIQVRKEPDGRMMIYVPDWLIEKNRINWNRITEIKPWKELKNGYFTSN